MLSHYDPIIILIKWYNVGPQTIAKLVQITPITMVYGTYNYSIHGAFVNQLTSLGGPTL